jgi:predicted ATP-grasp superfamily ATP-dependent carboligase
VKKVLLLDGNQRSALAATRSLGGKGVFVITAESKKQSLAGSSRYASRNVVYPSPYTSPSHFISAIKDLIAKHGVDIILPMTDVTTGLVLQHKPELGSVVLPYPSYQAFDLVTDKRRLFELAVSLGITVPASCCIEDAGNLGDVYDRLTFPIVIKPARSKVLLDGRWVGAPVRYAHCIDDIKTIINANPVFRRIPILIQEYVRGQGKGIFALFDRGKPIAFFAHRRLREKPPSGGVSVLSESMPLDPDMRGVAERVLSHVCWHGIAMVEFKVQEDKTPWLIELNGRFWGSLQLAIDSGMDFPYMLYQLAAGMPVESPSSYTIGQKSRWLLGDLDHLYLVLRGKGTRNTKKRRFRALVDFLKLFQSNTRYDVNRLQDLRPFLFEVMSYLRK